MGPNTDIQGCIQRAETLFDLDLFQEALEEALIATDASPKWQDLLCIKKKPATSRIAIL